MIPSAPSPISKSAPNLRLLMIYDDPKFIPQHIEGKGNVVNNHRNIHTHQLEFWAQLEPWDLNLERRNTIGERPCSGVVNFACENVQRW